MNTTPDLDGAMRHARDGRFMRHTLFVVLLAAVAAALWRLRLVVVLVFGALVLAVGLRVLVMALVRRSGLSARWALPVVLLTLMVALAGGFWLAGDSLVSQLGELREQLPRAIEAARSWLDGHPIGERISSAVAGLEATDGWVQSIGGMASLTLAALGNAALLLVMAVYFAADPDIYLRGAVRLAPVRYRPRLRRALRATGDALASWLMGQSISMAFVGGATALGLWLLGMPLALSLGFIAGLLSFVPYFGPIASGVLAVALAFTESPAMALWVALLFLAIQQVEGNLLMPFVQRWATSLPPVLALVAVLAFGILFGVPGIIFATPLMVALMIIVRRLYVHDLLESTPEATKTDRCDESGLARGGRVEAR
ncbi:MAG: AI-2E family transporter [Burkholderiaceae bacterium]